MTPPTPDATDALRKARCFRLRALLGWSSVVYAVLLGVFLAVLELWSRPHWLWSGLLFLPPQLWLAPLLVLTPLCVLWHKPLCALHLAIALGVGFGYMGFRWHRPLPARAPALTVVTANVGQRDPRRLAAFLEQTQPDVVLYQDGRRPGLLPTANRAGFWSARQREFVVASRWPIRSSGLVGALRYDRQPVAAWFELDWNGRAVVLYNVHMPTPRRFLEKFRGEGYGLEAVRWRGLLSRADRDANAAYWQERKRLAEGLREALRRETRPMIVAGDFNMPDHGWLYRMFAREWTDAFAARGRGWGMTFPGRGGPVQQLIGPWLRLDYVLCDAHWRVLDCVVEPPQPAEHRAVMARLEFQGEDAKTPGRD
ncbi:MAG: endonuclease/exonuclease/phosphatase family protein [Verrucomicrobiales bacterium]|nr:endonuclease/exonuclease/phosphatase family protein [Verrucomicrobiales bacterium]